MMGESGENGPPAAESIDESESGEVDALLADRTEPDASEVLEEYEALEVLAAWRAQPNTW